METLEPRVLFSGSPAPAPEAAPAEAPAAQESAAEAAPEATAPATEETAIAAPPAAAPSEEIAASADAGSGDTAITLTDTELAALTEAASSIWAASGISEEQAAALSSASYQIADLGVNILGSAEGTNITIDDDAAGRGWFVDGTPEDNGEFELTESGSLSSGTTGIDLLSILLHEQGHLLGLEDLGGGETPTTS